MEQKKVFEYIIHTAVGKFTGFAPVKLAEPFGEQCVAYHLTKMPTDTQPSIFVRGDAIIAVECNEIQLAQA